MSYWSKCDEGQRELAAAITGNLFVNGNQQQATRLVMATETSPDLGGWCMNAVREVIARHLYETRDIRFLPPGFEVARRIRPSITITIRSCARCGEDHEELVFEKLDQPDDELLYWAMCPKSWQPIMATVSFNKLRAKSIS